jgi:hypothetical protein
MPLLSADTASLFSKTCYQYLATRVYLARVAANFPIELANAENPCFLPSRRAQLDPVFSTRLRGHSVLRISGARGKGGRQ